MEAVLWSIVIDTPMICSSQLYYEDRTRYGEIHNGATREGGMALCVSEVLSHVGEFPASALLYWGQLPWGCQSSPGLLPPL